jgi:hypothetical protein
VPLKIQPGRRKSRQIFLLKKYSGLPQIAPQELSEKLGRFVVNAYLFNKMPRLIVEKTEAIFD